ncbi:hypothetical protein AJ79_00153 [Helicocarpus griseus UAMH5409]|uniref:CHAT domain-containing protein n=1 Tax=Helicocarpus griseus UAMH5409 TaxID=1447875 RepID=A0A2B7YC09_9EURO|nr:hypothetical protein AJ79_00153 [Helicocarpus griseus UAMH5409]
MAASRGPCLIPASLLRSVFGIALNTRIIAVCGATDLEGAGSQNKDGWLFRDFYLFHTLLRGHNVPQIWMTTEHPKDLVDKYGPYLHGNPFHRRKVVLDSEMIVSGKIGPITICDRATLKSDFITTLRSEVQAAREDLQDLLILVFGHGDIQTHGIILGTGEFSKLRSSNINGVVHNTGIFPELLSTSCYSGAWSIKPERNITTITADSSYWDIDTMLSSISGSIWGSAVMSALLRTADGETDLGTDLDDLLPEDATQEQKHALDELLQAVWKRFFYPNDSQLSLASNGSCIAFSAQDNGWDSFWRGNERHYNALKDYPTPEPQDRQVIRIRATLPFQRIVEQMAKEYFDSRPGSDVAFHKEIMDSITGPGKEFHSLQRPFAILAYRLNLIALADRYIALVCEGLNGYRCADWDDSLVPIYLERKMVMYDRLRRQIYGMRLFPPPYKTQGKPWFKPANYLAAILTWRSSNKEWAEKMLQILKKVRNRVLNGLSGRLLQDPDIQSKRKEVAKTLRKEFISPPKERGIHGGAGGVVVWRVRGNH